MPPKKKDRQFILVRWLQDETVGVMPHSAVHKDARTCVGAMVQAKYGRKFYDAEILKISDDCRHLNKVCDSLINFEITREELLRQADTEVDSTTEEVDSPVKKPRLENKVKKMASISKSKTDKNKLAFSKVEAAKSRAKEIFSEMAPTCSSDLDSSSEDEEMMKQVRDQLKLIEIMKKQLQEKSNSPPTLVTKNVVSNSNFEALQKNTTICVDTPSSTEFDDDPFYSQDIMKTPSDSTGSCHKSGKTPSGTELCDNKHFHGAVKTPSRKTDGGSSTGSFHKSGKALLTDLHASRFHKAVKTPPNELLESGSHSYFHKSVKMEPTKLELVPGYGVMITQRQLDEAEGESNGSPTRLIRNLMSVFFSREELARSSCYGSRLNAALVKDILLACIKYVQKKHTVAKTALVDAINDKCANCRRKERKCP